MRRRLTFAFLAGLGFFGLIHTHAADPKITVGVVKQALEKAAKCKPIMDGRMECSYVYRGLAFQTLSGKDAGFKIEKVNYPTAYVEMATQHSCLIVVIEEVVRVLISPNGTILHDWTGPQCMAKMQN